MVLVRLVAMMGIILSVIAIAIQNQSPQLALVFLGVRSQPLPLGLWIASAFILGALVSVSLGILLSFASPVAASDPQRPSHRRSFFRWPQFNRSPPQQKSSVKTPRRDSSEEPSDWYDTPGADWYSQSRSRRSDSFWEDESDFSEEPMDEYGEDDDEYDQPYPSSAREDFSDSAYSFSDHDPEFTRQSGQRESVFDAEYRVLNPPQKPIPRKEDWDKWDDELTDEP
ncbi:MAG: hypothetical protein HC851_16900 [Acaryochloris sp. RU_4_1]|nr:hypothetical protein [Acaryochloris sp. SU_5_25]NJM67227.1 hypothetical protein [Acaryochloris sp. RU_4_1]NJN38629.1 hypothetical protein [Acaryochloridaceae cyanobacterium CSU_3_4]NJR55941.1 hypothetical protein [Acaryochloris sp. CRU_2_0]